MGGEHQPAASSRDPTRPGHWLGFLAAGGLAFLVDAAVLEAGARFGGLDPFTARVLAIVTAMLVGWLAHRRLTFAVTEKPSVAEFLRYFGAAASAAIVNYAVYAAALLSMPWLHRLAALVLASAIAMVFSYLAMRYAVFRRSPN